MDRGRAYTDAEVKRLESQIRQFYMDAEAEAKERLDAHLKRFEKNDSIMRGKLSKKDYAKWREMQIMTGKSWKGVCNDLATMYTNATKEAYKATNASVVDVFCENVNYNVFAIESFAGAEISRTLMDTKQINRLLRDQPNLLPLKEVEKTKNGRKFTAKVQRWNKQKVSNAVAMGLSQGDGSKQISKRLRMVTDMDYKSSVRNARTSLHAAQNAGKLESMFEAEALGIKTEKQWLTVHDGRARHSHRQTDGEIVPLKETFSNGCMHPADPLAPPEEVYNCRCTMFTVIDDKRLDTENLPMDAYGKGSYEEWKASKANYESSKAVGQDRIIHEENGSESIDTKAYR